MKKIGVLFVGLLLVSSCKSLTKATPAARTDTSLRPKVIQQQISKNFLSFETLQWRGHATLDRGGKRQKISLNTRIKQNEGIWLNGSMVVPLARVLITPKELQFYEKINRQYIKIDYKRLENILGFSADYLVLEHILTAKPVEARALKRSKLSFTDSTYVFSYTRKETSIQYIYDGAFRLMEQRLKNAEATIGVVYKDYKKIRGQWIPETIYASLFEEKGTTTVLLNAKQIQLNEALKMPFNIPKNYTPILDQ